MAEIEAYSGGVVLGAGMGEYDPDDSELYSFGAVVLLGVVNVG